MRKTPEEEPVPGPPVQGCYVELHCHSAFSLREGASLPSELMKRAKRLGYKALALTDHDSLAGAMQFAQAARAAELKAIIGAEITLEDNSHLTLLTETQRGYANLSKMLSRANLNSPRGEPRVSFAWLYEYAEGLIALSGCRKGEVARLIETKELKAARDAAERYRKIFGACNYFIELQNNLVFGDEERNQGLVNLARELGLGIVATNNVHYAVQPLHRLHDVLVAVRHHTNLEDARPHLRPNAEFYLKTASEMERLFAELPEAIENTALIAERCQFDLTRDLNYKFPDYQAPDGLSADEFLRKLCYQQVRDIYRNKGFSEANKARLDQELKLIADGGWAGFFLRLWDVLRFTAENKMPARGRGSSVGSLVCYLLGLSNIDPLSYNLVVERFLNEKRVETDVPDVDIDFGRKARDDMFRHIFKEYGTDKAAMVCTFIEYRYPSAIRDAGKALGLPEGEVDSIAKLMHRRFAGRLEEELQALPEFTSRMQFPIWQDFICTVNNLLGLPRHLSQHSGGIILSSTRIDEQVPVEAAAMEDRYICQWDKDSVADANFIKLDLLGYPSLDQWERGANYVLERYGRDIKRDVRLDDDAVYEMIQRGDVLGIVQIQSRAQIQVLLRIKVARIEDLIIQVALIRPGPIQGGAVHPYIARCLGLEEVSYDHPDLKDILEETKGVFVFQEQVFQASMIIAGFSRREAEQLRWAMNRKRSREAMNELRDEFMTGAVTRGVDADTANTVFDKILAFASFGFPKSHAAAMAVTAYQIAWLKNYYPPEFYCALLNEQPMGFYSPEVIANDARRHDVAILGVDVNKSAVECTIEADPTSRNDAVRLGYKYLKHVGEAAYERLEAERLNGQYSSLWDFWRRTRLERKAIESLINVGAFAWTGLHERELIWQLGVFYQPLNAQMPLALLSLESMPALRSLSRRERISIDTRLVGIAVRGHSMELIEDFLHEGMTPSNRLLDLEAGEKVTVGGLVAVRQAPETAKGFIFHTLEDYHGLMNVITRPSLLKQFRYEIESAAALIVYGHIEREERAVNVIAERFEAIGMPLHADKRVHNFG